MSGADPWLEPWLPWLRAHAGEAPVFEIGCGSGHDTHTLCDAGLAVVAIEQDAAALARAAERAPAARFLQQDLRDAWPVADGTVGVVLASLSLHYFDAATTAALFQRLHRVLRPGGALLCRLNSSRDDHYGARGHPLIEPGYFLVDGQPKRFFDEAAVRALMSDGWRIERLRERETTKYGPPKVLWELAAETTAG